MPFLYRFRPRFFITVIAVLTFIFFLRLGYWQIARAAEKKNMLQTQAQSQKKAPIVWTSAMKMPTIYQRIKVQGAYLPEIILLDNQYHQHQWGYSILTPFLLNTNQVILIDRGWVAAEKTRRFFPQIVTNFAPTTLVGSTYYPSEKIWTLGQLYERKRANLLIIEKIDVKLVSQLLHKTVYPFIMRLDKTEPGGYIRDWPVVSMPPERHYAYALQWFVMAIVVLILFVVLNLKKINENH